MAHPPIDQQITFLSTSDLAETASFYEQIMELPSNLTRVAAASIRSARMPILAFARGKQPMPNHHHQTLTAPFLLSSHLPSMNGSNT